MFGNWYSHDPKQLPEHAKEFGRFGKSVDAFENAKAVLFHPPEQTAINRTHDFGADHGTAILARESGRGSAEMFARTIGLKLHQPQETLVMGAGGEVGLGIPEPFQILARKINPAYEPSAGVAHIATRRGSELTPASLRACSPPRERLPRASARLPRTPQTAGAA